MYAIVIPSLNPDGGLPRYVAALRAMVSCPILLVDDGSREESKSVFDECAHVASNVIVLRHDVNRGKGRALKTAFSFLLEKFPDIRGCVTCDSDGQHAPEDVRRALDALDANQDSLVLGCRMFDLAHVPWKSRFGNKWSRTLLSLASGVSVADTQTGLRAIPAEFMRELVECPGERFEFETYMLLRLRGRPLVQMPIQTLYIDGNRETHFSPWRDSPRIMGIIIGALLARMARFCAVSIASFALDIGLFALLYRLVFHTGGHAAVVCSTVVARAISLLFNYWTNSRLVFGSAEHGAGSFIRYLALAVVLMLASGALTDAARMSLPGVRIEVAKSVIDLCLWLVSYSVQAVCVFGSGAKGRKGQA